MNELPLLSVITFLPLVGAFVIYLLASVCRLSDNFYKIIGIAFTLIVLVLVGVIWFKFDNSAIGFQFIEKTEWIKSSSGIFYSLGVDGTSMIMIALTGVMMPFCLLAGWQSITKNVKEFVIAFLVMETFIMGTFLAIDLLLFYVFFEAVLIPMYLIIGIWGGKNRLYAAFKLFLYTLAGSLFLLLGIIYIYFQTETTFIPDLVGILPLYDLKIQNILWLAFFVSFAVKIPMWPLHTWLPDAHVEAPTAGSVVLAGILLKLGGYGLIRFSIPFFPAACEYFANFVLIMSAIAVVYTSLVALMQQDMKKLIAYSSIAHMGYVTAGLFVFNQQAVEGAIFQMVSHGLVSGALFICVGILYDRMHTKEISFYNGLTHPMPKFAFQFMIFVFASIGLPATSGFIGEFLVLLGVFRDNRAISMLLATGMFLGAAYMLWLFARVMYGKITNPQLESILDINRLEKILLWPLAVMVIVLGVYPNLIFDKTHTTIANLLSQYNSQVGVSSTQGAAAAIPNPIDMAVPPTDSSTG